MSSRREPPSQVVPQQAAPAAVPHASREGYATASLAPPAAAQSMSAAAADASPGYDLGKLNRHWYRRCLDALGAQLAAMGTSPSIEQLQELCGQTITSFLTAVTGQAPDSDRPQFPADRACYIPFEGDRAETFDFAKPYYQLLNRPDGYPDAAEHSLWSFLPWADGAASDFGVAIDCVKSLDKDGRTLSFEKLLADQQQDSESARRQGSVVGGRQRFQLRKSLMLRGHDHETVREAFSAGITDKRRFYRDIELALVNIFEIYKAVPGQPAIELLLFNHFQILHWLWIVSHSLEASDRIVLSQQDADYTELFGILLTAYFLTPDDSKSDVTHAPAALEEIEAWVDRKGQATEAVPAGLLKLLSSPDVADTPFSRAVARRLAKKQRRPAPGAASATDKTGHTEACEEELYQLRPHFRSFRDYFLKSDIEERLERDLAAALPDDARRAGEVKGSFVWVCPDFDDLNESLPESLQARSDSQKQQLAGLQHLLPTILGPYQQFFRALEVQALAKRKSAISNYWRTRGQAARDQWVYASFNGDGGLAIPPDDVLKHERLAVPRPQNIFLRVRICDSLNEPMIDGLFVFTTDHDERVFKGKGDGIRREDVEDLLSFAKVFFFIVRDHLHGLDRARDSADIGRLNQHLYDRRLADLDRRMNARVATQEFERRGVTEKANWDKFAYEVLNNFAFSLLEKPEDVRNETFPYDRLLIIPLPERNERAADGDSRPYALPFYLFQSVYVECTDHKIGDSHYSLLKPFQSPVEELDAKAGTVKRFRARSFQEVSDNADGQKLRLRQYLQKHYIGAVDVDESRNHGPDDAAPDEPASYVVKAAGADQQDRGKEWSESALRGFWSGTKAKERRGLWSAFLIDLTESYRTLIALPATEAQASQLTFLFRFGLLRAVLRYVNETDSRDRDLQALTAEYARELELRFGGDDTLNLIKLALTQDSDPLAALTQREMLPDSPNQITFVDHLLGAQDRWTVEFLKQLTLQVRNSTDPVGAAASCVTWYQDILTRPVDATQSPTRHHRAADLIGNRMPPYDKIESGQDAISTFVGFVNLKVGQTEFESRRLRCVVVMLRDYDDTKTGRVLEKREAERKLAVDRNDLTLYARTFFQNVHRLLTTARERQQVSVLSTDITQIARSWYSNGIDHIVASLHGRLQNLVDGADAADFGRLRAEIVDSLFDSLLDVLTRSEKRRDNDEDIGLESFPFDRVLHVPLLFGRTDAARWCYARTTYTDHPQAAGDPDASAGASRLLYEKIRRLGRHAVLGHTRKALTPSSPWHLDPAEFEQTLGRPAADGRPTVLQKLQRLSDPALLDRFVRRLNKANALQTLALAGTLFHGLKHSGAAGGPTADRSIPGAAAVVKELRDVLERNIRSLEREEEFETVLTEAHLERAVSLADAFGPADGDREGQAFTGETLGDVASLPFFREVFEAVEGPDFQYGLDPDVRSKVFYVYYSVPAPDGFIEQGEIDSRYRGVFCFIVDDTSTDDKRQGATLSSSGELSDAEAADQDDIRTFVHNAMSTLRLILMQQSFQHQIHRPGVDQDLLGMLHRLKNELAIPVWSLYPVRDALESPDALTSPERLKQRGPELVAKIDKVQSTIAGIEGLFANMKRVSDLQHGHVPLQTFSSDWVAWTFLAHLCNVARATLERHDAAKTGPLQAAADINAMEQEAKRRLSELDTDSQMPDSRRSHEQALDAVEAVQRRLMILGGILNESCRQLFEPAEGVTFMLGFEVYSADEPLQISASHLLEEALNILVENAFQALWSHMQKQVRDKKAPVVARLRLVCRPSEDRPDEVLLDLRNSSGPIPEKQLEEMNADPPRTLSAQLHSELSGKKGGSGFGHYFARRIVSEYCGGRQARRQLDARISYEARRREARTVVRLLAPAVDGYRTISLKDVASSVASVFKDAAAANQPVLALEDGANRYYMSKGFRLRSLLQLIRELPAADRELKIKELTNFLENGVCENLRSGVDALRADLFRYLDQTKASQPDLSRRLEELQDRTVCRNGCLHELNDFLKNWRKRDTTSWKRLVTDVRADSGAVPGFQSLAPHVESIQNGADLVPGAILTRGQRESFARRLAKFGPYLTKTAHEAGTGFFLDSLAGFEMDAAGGGIPIPVRTHVAGAFRRAIWEYAVEPSASDVAVTIRVQYPPDERATAHGVDRLREEVLTPKQLRQTYSSKMVGRTIVQYWDDLQSRSGAHETPIGDLRLVRYIPSTNDVADVPQWVARITLNALGSEAARDTKGEQHDER